VTKRGEVQKQWLKTSGICAFFAFGMRMKLMPWLSDVQRLNHNYVAMKSDFSTIFHYQNT